MKTRIGILIQKLREANIYRIVPGKVKSINFVDESYMQSFHVDIDVEDRELITHLSRGDVVGLVVAGTQPVDTPEAEEEPQTECDIAHWWVPSEKRMWNDSADDYNITLNSRGVFRCSCGSFVHKASLDEYGYCKHIRRFIQNDYDIRTGDSTWN